MTSSPGPPDPTHRLQPMPLHHAALSECSPGPGREHRGVTKTGTKEAVETSLRRKSLLDFVRDDE